MHPVKLGVLAATIVALGLIVSAQPAPGFLSVDQVRPGMVGVGRTIFSGDQISEFQVEIIAVLHNVVGPKRDLILAKLSGGPLADTGVIAGMSGSPVYIDGRLVGAVSYALGSFPKEPLAGITPIGEMTMDTDASGARPTAGKSDFGSVTTPAEAFDALRRLSDRAAAPLALSLDQLGLDQLPADSRAMFGDFAPVLRPIGAAMVIRGFTSGVGDDLASALGAQDLSRATAPRTAAAPTSTAPLRAGEAVGISLIHGDFETGATGTVTYVDGARVYAFGHPFLNLGPTSMAMTRSHVFTVLPSLANSMKIADMGAIVGAFTQDRESAIGGTLGPPPNELKVSVSLESAHAPSRQFNFFVLHDPALTPLFAYVSVLNTLSSYERQNGALSVAVNATASFGKDGTITIDDAFTGDTAVTGPATAIINPIAAMIDNAWRASMPETLDVRLTTSETQEGDVIERAWLDTSKPHFGATHTLHVLLRHFRGTTDVVSFPVAMPAHTSGALSLVVCDAPTLTNLEQHELKPGAPHSVNELVADLNATRRNNRLYVRLIEGGDGTVVGGETLPSLPTSVRDVLGADHSSASAPISKTVLGAWELRLDHVVRGSRTLPITLTNHQ